MLLIWITFLALILFFLMLDLGVFHRRVHVVSIREALTWFGIWVTVSLLFNVAVYFLYEYHLLGIGLTVGHPLSGRDAALQYFTGYLLEESLSVDNMFVIAMIFSFFGVPAAYQHRVLFWGILGAMVMRGIMIAAGTALINRIEWITYIFGVLLILTAVKMLITSEDQIDPERNPLVRFARKLYPVTPGFHGQKFFVRMNGKRAITPLFLVLLVIESSDLLFAIDSIPAILAVTRDPFIVFTSNVFAILGLRSIYFALSGMMHRFRYLKLSLVFLLAFIGAKMLMAHFFKIPIEVSLIIIAGILSVGVLASLVASSREQRRKEAPLTEDLEAMALLAWRHTRRIVVLILGGSVLLVGLALLVLPGPAFVVIPIGLAILALEFAWARRLLAEARRRAGQATGNSAAGGALALGIGAAFMALAGYGIWIGSMALFLRKQLGPDTAWHQLTTALFDAVADGHWHPVPSAIFTPFGVGLLLAVIGVVVAVGALRRRDPRRRLALAACALGGLTTLVQVASIVTAAIISARDQGY